MSLWESRRTISRVVLRKLISQGESSLKRFQRDESGTYVIIMALAMPVLVGTAGLGTEVGWWLYKHKNMQSAAD